MKKSPIAVAMAFCLTFSNAMADDDNNYHTYHVTITNATGNHFITPPVIIAHNKHFKLFQVTQKASDELATMAETGNNAPLLALLVVNDNVSATASGVGIHPSESITIEIMAPKETYFTVAGMLAASNDAFTSVTIKAPKKHRYAHGMAMTYDAGSETNNEICDYIPGPPCNSTNMSNDGEGFVTIHNGIHGIEDLVPADLDWRGPTAMVRIYNDD